MPFLVEDTWINAQASTCDITDLQDCAIAVDATYWLNHLLDLPPAHEPLLPALGGLTGIQTHINENLDHWERNGIVPFFVFDGQSITGQDDVSLGRRRAANLKTDDAWELYLQSRAEQAVATFGANPGAYNVQNLYPLLQVILKKRNLHFLVPPYNASAQLAYFELIDSDQCAGVMGSLELLMYPIKDSVIRSFDWEAKTVTFLSKKRVMRVLSVGEPMFIDAMLMTGTSFIPPFPPLLDVSMYPNPSTIMDAVNLLRTSDKSITTACASFNDILQTQDPDWLDKYRKARMAVHHFIFVAENGEVRVNDFDRLTKDSHEYLGLQLPAELFHYLSTGLISARNLNCITHSQIVVQPTLDGVASDEYRKLVTEKILPLKEQALGLIIPRVHRGIGHKDITMRVWFDTKFSYKINHRALQPPPSQRVGTWDVKEADLHKFCQNLYFTGPISREVLVLLNDEFIETSKAKGKAIRGIDSAEMVTSVAIWRFLHLRNYVDDEHKLTMWGNALAGTLLALTEANDDRLHTPALCEAALLAFELIRFDVLNGKYVEGLPGMPRKGSDKDKSSLVLISRLATLLEMRHQVYGYTGPLNKSLLAFRSLSSAAREAARDLMEAIVASMFMYGQSKRERNDYLDISQRLPFLREPDIGLGVAMRTFFDDDDVNDSKETRAENLAEFPKTFVPFAEALADDFRLCVKLLRAINTGLQTLESKDLATADREAWTMTTTDELADEVSAINSIYGAGTLTATEREGEYSIKLATSTLRLRFPPSYPFGPEAPSVLGCVSVVGSRGDGEVEAKRFAETLRRVFSEGVVCLFDALEEGGGLDDVEVLQSASALRQGRDEDGKDEDEDLLEETKQEDWIISDTISERKSSFVAHAHAIRSPAEARSRIASLLCSNRRLRDATHNIVAWRVRGSGLVTYSDCDDDGEAAAGGRLLRLLQLCDAWDVVVVVSRWFGGVRLGPRRFAIINAVAREALVRGGWVAS
ncbi:hypothetical protein CP533_6018 [Ophiocordyceps camponoti-saundersi (nom. inval.)]|nr:hypothetical protein CP533_6018 [Ophiocordyceps camponoti-saundersi (nom. inval.)]